MWVEREGREEGRRWWGERWGREGREGRRRGGCWRMQGWRQRRLQPKSGCFVESRKRGWPILLPARFSLLSRPRSPCQPNRCRQQHRRHNRCRQQHRRPNRRQQRRLCRCSRYRPPAPPLPPLPSHLLPSCLPLPSPPPPLPSLPPLLPRVARRRCWSWREWCLRCWQRAGNVQFRISTKWFWTTA